MSAGRARARAVRLPAEVVERLEDIRREWGLDGLDAAVRLLLDAFDAALEVRRRLDEVVRR